MKISTWTPNSIQISTSAKRDALLLLALYLFNVFAFSGYLQLGQVATKPWLLLVWLYGLAGLVPLAWRDRAPVTGFVIQWVLAVAAWPIILRYVPIVGIPIALYAVSLHCSRKSSLLALLASFIPIGVDSAVLSAAYSDPASKLESFIPNAAFLVVMTVGAWGAGRTTRAVQQQVQHLERERETVREAVAAERRRIARELHEIVSETTGKKAIAELRRLLRTLEASHPPSHAAGIGERGL